MISAVILAAGRSRRMGAPKLLLPLGGRPVIEHVADAVLASSVHDTWVVVSPESAGIRQALGGRGVQFVSNPYPEEGMLSSVRCGLRAVSRPSEAILVLLGDQPGLTAAIIERLIAVYRTAGKGLVLPTHGGRRGHPLLLDFRYRDEILSGYERTGLRGLLEAHLDAVAEVEMPMPAVLEDMDTPEDYQRIARGYEALRTSHGGRGEGKGANMAS